MEILKDNKGFILLKLIITFIILFFTIGWVINAVKLSRCDFDAPYKAEIIRTVGVIAAPFGSVVGYINIAD